MAAKKNKTKADAVDQLRPFLGLRSFEESNKNQFGGRDQEIEELFNLVEDQNLTVVFGTSGIGKTSLLKAGLLPELRKNFFFPIYIRIDFSSRKQPLNQLKDHVYKAMKSLDSSVSKIENETLWEYLHNSNFLKGLVIPVLIFDQFEELFTLGKNKKGIKEFITELSNLALNRIPSSVKQRYKKEGKTVPYRYNKLTFRVVISLREDYLAKLDSLKKHIPTIMDNGFRIIQMETSQAMEAAIKPGKGLIDRKVAKEIIDKLPGVAQGGFDLFNEPGNEQNQLMVEPFLLSLICQRLNEQRIKQNLQVITSELVAEFKVDGIITSYYEDCLSEFDPKVDKAIQEHLIDAEGYRKLDALKEFQEEYQISDEEVRDLIDARIVRKENRNNVDYLELIHDVLAPVIKKKRAKRIRLEKQKAKDDLIAKNRKKIKRRVIIGFVSLIAFGIMVGIYIWLDFKQKQNDIWEFATETNTKKGYITFRHTFPYSSHDKAAKDSIISIVLGENESNWIAANEANSTGAFKNYISQVDGLLKDEELDFLDYPKLKDSLESSKKSANQKIEEIQEIEKGLAAKEQEAWKKAEEEGTFSAYIEYINKGYLMNRSKAISKMEELGYEGWLYSGRVIDDQLQEFLFEFDQRDQIAQAPLNRIPQYGDILVLKVPDRRSYPLLQVMGDRRERAHLIIEQNSPVYVLQTVIDGTALFLKVLFEK